jgi:hypothetical protein
VLIRFASMIFVYHVIDPSMQRLLVLGSFLLVPAATRETSGLHMPNQQCT